MRPIIAAAALGLALTQARGGDEWLDRLDDALTFGSADGQVRARLSGTMEVDGYSWQGSAPGLIYGDGDTLVAPRLTVYLDVQAGERLYAFVQARADDGFDPGDGGKSLRLDEYALRAAIADHGALNIQVGKFATAFGNWVQRHYAWDDPFITAPLPYENLTGIFDAGAARSTDSVLHWSGVRPSGSPAADYFRDYQVPVIWGPSYASGLAVSGSAGRFEYVAEVKNASLSSRPQSWDVSQREWQEPTLTARVAFRPDQAWTLGFSASSGSYLLASAAPSVAPGYSLQDYRETVLGQDLSYAWHHFEFWAEVMEARFAIPTVGNAGTTAYYLEAKYKFAPQFFAAIRWNQQFFGRLSDPPDGDVTWGRDVWRIDVAPTVRFTPHVQLKLQYSLLHNGSAERVNSSLWALQGIVRF